ncbi:MAG: NlpC/P60 family protein [Beijerinckiaceae bacterium]
MTAYDRRLTPARPDLAAAELEGHVNASRYVAGRAMHVTVEVADLHNAPSHEAGIDTQALFGEDVLLYEDHEGWGWVQLSGDSYVGYVSMNALADGKTEPSHIVCVNRTFVYPGPNMKLPIGFVLPLGARVTVVGGEPPFFRLIEGGFVFSAHLKPRAWRAEDFVAVAEGLIGAPYLWGGKTSQGLDCSGLVQIALAQAGIDAPRDTDLQEATLGRPVDIGGDLSRLRRGDLVFWKGHVGIMRDSETLLHANAHLMLVVSEPLREARERIAKNGAGTISTIKRL